MASFKKDKQPALERPSLPDPTWWAVLGCFVLSGFAALLYETAWLRQFSVVFGTSELAVSAVLASYMGGLALGATVAARWVSHVRRPVLTYGLLELGIAVSALTVPLILQLARGVQQAVLGGQPEPYDATGLGPSLFWLLTAFLVLMVPTGLMGATLPLLVRHAVRRDDEVGRRTGLLYAGNTVGAVAGTLVAACVLLPAVGLWQTLLVGAGVNAAVFALAAWLSQQMSPLSPDAAAQQPTLSNHEKDDARSRWVLPLMLGSGIASFTYEVLWARLLGHLLGASTFAFATMLASFLAGIALGSAVSSRLATDRARSVLGLTIAQAGMGILSIGVFLSLDYLPGLARRLGAGEQAGLWANLGLAACVLLPATCCIGATFPFAVRILSRQPADASRAAARVYAWSTLGAISGAVLAGFIFIPMLEHAGTARLAVALNLILAAAAALLRPEPIGRRTVTWAAVGAVVVAIAPFPEPWRLLGSSPLAAIPPAGRVVHLGVGHTASILVAESGAYFDLRSNGLTEAGIAMRGSRPGAEPGRWLGALPSIARPEAKNALVVGFGGGVAVSGVGPWINEVDVVELEPEILDANRVIAKFRQHDPLSDPRVRLIVGDARGVLALTEKRWDVIASQPSYPWTSGASHLYTREFVRLAKEHLTPGGVFVQWIGSRMVDQEIFQALASTLLGQFEHVRLYLRDSGRVLFLASDEPVAPEEHVTALHDAHLSYFHNLGVLSPEDVVAGLVLDDPDLRKLCSDVLPNTDDHNRLATSSVRALHEPLGDNGVLRLAGQYDALVSHGSVFHNHPSLTINWIRIVQRLHYTGFPARAQTVSKACPNEIQRLQALALLADLGHHRDEVRRLLQRVLTIDPENTNARFSFVRPWIKELARGTAPADITAQAERLTGPEAAVIKAWGFIGQGEWTEVRALDETLARSGGTDRCLAMAAYLRAAWRNKFSEHGGARDLATQALTLIETALAVEPTSANHRLRADAARLAGKSHALLATTYRLVEIYENQFRKNPPPQVRTQYERATRDAWESLQQLVGQTSVEPHRVTNLMTRLNRLAPP